MSVGRNRDRFFEVAQLSYRDSNAGKAWLSSDCGATRHVGPLDDLSDCAMIALAVHTSFVLFMSLSDE